MAASSASFKYISSKCLQNDKLISLIRKHPLLYNTELKEYKDNQLKTIIWRNIALECCLKGEDDAKRLWKNLRDGYRLILKNKKKGKTSKAHKFYEQMEFVLPYMKIAGEIKESDLSSEEICDIKEEEVIEDEGVQFSYFGENEESSLTSLKMDRKRKRSGDFEVDSESGSLPAPEKVQLAETETNNSLKLFFDSMCAATEKLPPQLQRQVRRAVLEIVSNAEEEGEAIEMNRT